MNINSDNKDNNKFLGNLDNLKKMDNEIDIDEENDDIEDLDIIIKRTHTIFKTGNESASDYEFSPKDILKDYEEFN